ncbi:maltase 1 [Manduca sexta]|uniref:alpha-glucosidase n=1 Tax=Manduca sexta TaxID=7130 RepID=A0A921Z7Z0_MANSE|nr:maltase 1 [Manduca sexta]KAG6453001.1 hypothetical protein O3G_MSEX007897 [Manduca sexta]
MWHLALVFLSALSHGFCQAPWWSNTVYYRILVDSFKDGDGDGLGDLKGAIKQLSYVRAVGADAVILSSLSSRSKDCSKPGVIDFAAIDERFGDIDTFNIFMEKAKKIDLKVVATLPLRTVSCDSEWFSSSADRVPGFEDRIVWLEGSADDPPPNESDSIKWVWHEPRSAYWKFVNGEALLDLCSEAIAGALSAAQCAWIRRGVNGLLLNPDFLDQKCGENLLKRLSSEAVSCARGAGMDIPVILVESSLHPETAIMYYGENGAGANSIISTALAMPTRPSAASLGIAAHAAMLIAPPDALPTWITSASGESRTTSRYGSELVDAVNLLALTLPGAAIIQQGDELGAADTILEWATNNNCWPHPGVTSASPFPWDDTVNGGFTAGEPWLPLAPNYRYANAKTEFKNDFSHASVVKVAAAMRKSPAMGPHAEIKRLSGALAVLRWGGSGSLLTVANLARDITDVQLSRIPGLPAEMTVVISSAGSRYSTGSHIAIDKSLKLGPGEAVLFAGGPRHCGGPGPVDKIATKITEGWQKLNKYFGS